MDTLVGSEKVIEKIIQTRSTDLTSRTRRCVMTENNNLFKSAKQAVSDESDVQNILQTRYENIYKYSFAHA